MFPEHCAPYLQAEQVHCGLDAEAALARPDVSGNAVHADGYPLQFLLNPDGFYLIRPEQN